MTDFNPRAESAPQTNDTQTNANGPEALNANLDNSQPETVSFDKRMRVILNPAAGQDEPALKVFNKIFREDRKSTRLNSSH